jgi:hypothetical protein
MIVLTKDERANGNLEGLGGDADKDDGALETEEGEVLIDRQRGGI